MNLIWTDGAQRNLREIVFYIGSENPAAARKFSNRIESLARYLAQQPFMGRPGAIAGTREAIPHPSYRLVYQVTEQTVHILAIVHTARQWPPMESDD